MNWRAATRVQVCQQSVSSFSFRVIRVPQVRTPFQRGTTRLFSLSVGRKQCLSLSTSDIRSCEPHGVYLQQ